MMPQPPSGQGPLDPRGAFSPPPAPSGQGAPPPPPPPQMMPMMPFYPPFPPPQRGGGFARAIFITLATTLFGMSLLANVYLLAIAGFTSSAAATKSDIIVSGDPSQKIAVIPVAGIITDETYADFDRVMRGIENDASIKALVVEIDTPGGEVTASDQIYKRLRQFKQQRGVPVVASMGAMATSGGYYIACATDEMIAQPTTLTGNIGVVLMRFDLSGTLEKWGAKETSITPDGSAFKNAESMFKPDNPQVQAYLKDIANDIYAQFRDVVSSARQSQITQAGSTIDAVADGRAYMAREALKLGLIDQIGYPHDAYARAATLAGLQRHHVVRYQRQPTLWESVGMTSRLSHNRGGINLSIDTRLLNELTSPRPMFLFRGD